MVPEQGKWKAGDIPQHPEPDLFDWNGTEPQTMWESWKTEGSTVYTVEGNSSNAVNQRSYNINNGTIMGYGIL